METRAQEALPDDLIQKRVVLRAPLSRVWRAIANPQELGAWFGLDIEGEFAPGATLTGRIRPTQVDPEVGKEQEKYAGMPFEITVESVEPERLFSFRWHPFAVDPHVDYAAEATTLVCFELEDANGGVELTIRESGFANLPRARRAQAFEAHAQGWATQTKLIEKYVSSS